MSAAVVRIQAMYRGWAVRRAMARAKVRFLILTTNAVDDVLIFLLELSGQKFQKGQEEVVKLRRVFHFGDQYTIYG